jgi:Tfp pilus assembly PilM family ATPase
MFNLNRKSKSTPAILLARAGSGRKRNSVTAFDLDGSTLRIVQASGQGASARVQRVASVPMEIPSDKRDQPQSVAAALKKALDQVNIKPKEVLFLLSRSQVILRPLELPMGSDVNELASMVNFQIAKDLPFRIDEAIVDFKLLRVLEAVESDDAVPQKRVELLVGAVKSDLINFYREVAKAAGFRLAGVGLRSVAAAHCAARKEADPTAAALLVCLRGEETTLEILLERKLFFSRVASVPPPGSRADTVQDRAAFLQNLQIEVVRTLHSYEGAHGHKPVRHLLVAGGTGLEEVVRAALGERLNLPSEIFDPADVLELKDTDRGEASASIAPIGLALAALDGGLPLDFANPKKPAVQGNIKRTYTIAAAAAVVVLLVTIFAVRSSLVKKRLVIRNEVQTQLADAEKKLPIYKRLKTQQKVVSGWLAEEQNWLDHLAYITGLLPGAEEIYVSSFTTSPQHLIRFSAQAKSGELLATLDKRLRAAGYEVKPLSITPANDKHGYNFRTTVELSIPRKMKADLSKAKAPPRPPDDVSLKPS